MTIPSYTLVWLINKVNDNIALKTQGIQWKPIKWHRLAGLRLLDCKRLINQGLVSLTYAFKTEWHPARKFNGAG